MNTAIRSTWFIRWTTFNDNKEITKMYELMNGVFIVEIPGCMSRYEQITPAEANELKNAWDLIN